MAAWLASLALLGDSLTFALKPYDQVTGRARGCYTAVELALGLKGPPWIRPAEHGLGAILFLGVPLAAVTVGVRAAITRRHKQNRPG